MSFAHVLSFEKICVCELTRDKWFIALTKLIASTKSEPEFAINGNISDEKDMMKSNELKTRFEGEIEEYRYIHII